MMHRIKPLAATLLIALLPATALADGTMVFGGDTYASGKTTTLDQPSPRSAFVSGLSATLDGPVTKDAHLAGGHVTVDAAVAGDLYTAGAWVIIDNTVGGDVSAAGYSVSLNSSAAVGGNARIAASEIDVNAPVSGSLLAAASEITINAEISGDVMLTAEDITFGPDARINGTLNYVSPSAIEIPSNVIAPDKVQHKRLTRAALATLARMTIAGEFLQDMDENGNFSDAAKSAANNQLRDDDRGNFGSLLVGFLVTLACLLLITALLLTSMPECLEKTRKRLVSRPFSSLGYGFVALSALIGAVPVSAMTIIGLPLVPFFILIVVIAWIMAYITATYALAWKAVLAIKPMSPTLINRLLATAAGFVLLSLTHYLWFFGWIINLLVVLVGLGAVATTCGKRMIERSVRGDDASAESEPSGQDTPETKTPDDATETPPKTQ